MTRSDPQGAKPKNGTLQLLIRECRREYRRLSPHVQGTWMGLNLVAFLLAVSAVALATQGEPIAIAVLGLFLLLLMGNNPFLVRLLLNRGKQRVPEPVTADTLRKAGYAEFGYGTHWKRNYRVEDVDDLLERVAQRLEGHGSVTAAEVRNTQFRKAKVFGFKYGYHPEEVDEFLKRVIAELEALDHPRKHGQTPPQTDSSGSRDWPTAQGRSTGKANGDTASNYELNHHSGQIY